MENIEKSEVAFVVAPVADEFWIHRLVKISGNVGQLIKSQSANEPSGAEIGFGTERKQKIIIMSSPMRRFLVNGDGKMKQLR